ncbi:hypothetical protein O181_006780 [Austropuccinia psidii MF-1]|uniref:Proteasome activator PA28 C-terminal domain-containing protein n=1 Tax=Austropuccinia psidii MF-1 TaxID=1389203 RepID=A0A9Q3GH73_9BASI|nr:hypothetical protein [Austropuccinia psidii MF-1]
MSSNLSNSLWTETVDKDIQSELRKWSNELANKGKNAVQVRLPQKILAINKVLENFSESSINSFIINPPTSDEPDTPPTNSRKKRRVANGKDSIALESNVAEQSNPAGPKNTSSVATNPKVNAHYEFLRQHWEELVTITNDIKIHINLLVPKIEDGDTFGVQVQEECLSELARAQDSGYNLLEAQLKHYMSRAKLASKLIKYPNIEDYQLALQEHDRNSVFLCRQHLVDLRNIYTLLTDLLHKNIVKITKPKGANSDGMY